MLLIRKIDLSNDFRHKTLEEQTTAFGGKLTLAGEFDWGEPKGRELW